jgi:DNA polymerase III subunit beta
MTLAIDATILKAITKQAALAASKTGHIAATSYMLIAWRDKTISARCTNLESEITASYTAEDDPASLLCDEAGEVCVDAIRLTAIAATIDDHDKIRLTLGAKGQLRVECGTSGAARYRLTTIPSDSYPDRIEINGGARIVMDGAAIRDALARPLPAAGGKDVRHYLNGVLLEGRDGTITGVASNGHIIIVRAAAHYDGDNFAAIVPTPFVIMVSKLLTDKEIAEVLVTSSTIRISTPTISLESRLVDGQYPDYRRLVSSDDIHDGIPLHRDTATEAIKRVKIASDERQIFRLTADGPELNIKTTSSHGAAEITLPIAFEAQERSLCVNAGYLLAAISQAPTEHVELTLDIEAPAIGIRGDGYSAKIMPIISGAEKPESEE